MVLNQRADRPGSRFRPLIGQRIEVSISHIHRLTITVDLSILTILGVRQTRIPSGVLSEGASEDDIVARAERGKVDFHARINAPADLALAGVAAGGRVIPQVSVPK